ncbi:MAG: GTPase ObgE [Oscillospiraceae bacterium]|nr:GTPase ObgE [Oscillospiraceae bacterium]
MFMDIAHITVKSGDGGNGAVSFHRQKYVAAGGPDGGDGGCGGNIYFQVDPNLNTLIDFKFKRKYFAENGQNGSQKNCSGKNGADLIIKVPQGTLIREKQSGTLLADCSGEEPILLLKGGKGGFGNQHFATPTRQVPRFAKPGIPGQQLELKLELKLLADVGLIGFPNAGKSTLISVVSAARPKIASYPFTTLEPNLGVVRMGDGASFVMADIPGIISGASEGAGLGHDFLRHVERCRLLLHLVDVSCADGRDPIEDYKTINHELSCFSEELANKPQIVVASKTDMSIPEQIEEFKEYVEADGAEFYEISSVTHAGLEPLLKAVWEKLRELPPITRFEPEALPEVLEGEDRPFTVTQLSPNLYSVEAPWIIPIFNSVNTDDYESLQYFQRVLRSSGIIEELEHQGVQEGDTVRIYNFDFDFIP